MHIAILMANTDDSDFAADHPEDGEKFANLLHPLRPDWRFSVFSVKDDVFPANPAAFDGFIITGSPASVHDDDPWVQKLFALIRAIEAQGQPMFGACFGHQAIAAALGGTVEANPNGWVFGLTRTHKADPAPWMKGDGGPVSLYAAHKEQVTQVPPGARILGGNADCPVGSFAIRDHIFTTQYHPEMTPEFISALTDELAERLPADVIAQSRASQINRAETGRIARWIVDFFEHPRA